MRDESVVLEAPLEWLPVGNHAGRTADGGVGIIRRAVPKYQSGLAGKWDICYRANSLTFSGRLTAERWTFRREVDACDIFLAQPSLVVTATLTGAKQREQRLNRR
jgi:hypothetical protein